MGTVALRTMGRSDDDSWFSMARYRSRQEFILSRTPPFDDPQAKDLVSYSQGIARNGKNEVCLEVADRAVAHNDAQSNIWILPIFVDHDRTAHAERQALLCILEGLPIDNQDEGVRHDISGKVRVYATHTPCISCCSAMCQFTRAFEKAKLAVTFDTWKETRRWIGLEGVTEVEMAEINKNRKKERL